MAKASKAQLACQHRYDMEYTVQYKFKFNKKTDADIIEVMEQQENKQGYIKRLIREDISRATDNN